jgi:hypothetical protein
MMLLSIGLGVLEKWRISAKSRMAGSLDQVLKRRVLIDNATSALRVGHSDQHETRWQVRR